MEENADLYRICELTQLAEQADEAERLGFLATARAMRKVLEQMHLWNEQEKKLRPGKAA